MALVVVGRLASPRLGYSELRMRLDPHSDGQCHALARYQPPRGQGPYRSEGHLQGPPVVDLSRRPAAGVAGLDSLHQPFKRPKLLPHPLRERAGLLLHPPRRTPFPFGSGTSRSSWVSRRTSNSLVLTMILMMSVISPIPSFQNSSGT